MAFGDDSLDGYTEGDEVLTFHYKKGSFREKEDEIYRNLATGKTKTSPGLIKSLFATKGNKFMFVTLVAVTVFAFMWGILMGGENRNSIMGLEGNLSCFTFDNQVYVTLEFSPEKKNIEYPVNINMLFEAINVEGSVCEKNTDSIVILDRNKTQVYKIFTDYDVTHVQCELSNDDKTEVVLLKALVKKRK